MDQYAELSITETAGRGGERAPRRFLVRFGIAALATLGAACLAIPAVFYALRWLFSSGSSGRDHAGNALIYLGLIFFLQYLGARFGAPRPDERPAWFIVSFVSTGLLAWPLMLLFLWAQ